MRKPYGNTRSSSLFGARLGCVTPKASSLLDETGFLQALMVSWNENERIPIPSEV